MVSLSHVRIAALALFVLPTFNLLVACGGDQCRPGESRCDGDGILSCGTPGDLTGERGFTALSGGCGADRCLDLVRDGNRVAVCSTTGTPDPRCPSGAAGPICVDGKTLLRCEEGYGSRQRTCDGACVVDTSGSSAFPLTFCAAEFAASSVCAGAVSQVCDGNVAVECARGWVTKRTLCDGDSPRCVIEKNELTIAHAFCARDEACSSAAETHCQSSAIEGCVGGHVVSMGCGEGSACEVYGIGKETVAACVPKCKAVRESVCLDP
jgi:hypothetical protein